MRDIGNHTPPLATQEYPQDNTNKYVMAQVHCWAEEEHDNLIIHTESAREIAAWWAEGTNGFAQFASTGTITDGLIEEIEEQIRETEQMSERATFATQRAEWTESLPALRALLAYIRACEIDAWEVTEGVPGQAHQHRAVFLSAEDAVTEFGERIEARATADDAGTDAEVLEYAEELQDDTSDEHHFALGALANYGGTRYPFGDLMFHITRVRMTYGEIKEQGQ